MISNNKIYLMVAFIGLANGLSGADADLTTLKQEVADATIAYELASAGAEAVLSADRRQQIARLDAEQQDLGLKRARLEGAHKAMALPRSRSQQTLLAPPACPTCPEHEKLIAKLRGDVIRAVDLGSNIALAERASQRQAADELHNKLVEAQTENAGLKRVIRDDSSSSSHYKIRYENLQKERSFLSTRNVAFGSACIAAGIAIGFYLHPKFKQVVKWLRNRTRQA